MDKIGEALVAAFIIINVHHCTQYDKCDYFPFMLLMFNVSRILIILDIEYSS